MRVEKFHQHFIFLVALELLLSTQVLAGGTLKFDQDVTVVSAGLENTRAIPKGETLEMNDSKPVLVEAQGFVPVLAIPIENKDSSPMAIRLHRVHDWPSKSTEQVINDGYDVLISSSVKIQGFLAAKNSDAAIAELDRLQQKFPNVTYLNFFRANALLLKGERAEAVASLKIALKDHPDNADGVALLHLLEGSK